MKLRIYKPAKNAMQSNCPKTKQWHVVFPQQFPQKIDPLMGWVGMRDTTQQLKLRFDSEELAVKYVEKNGFDYELVKPKERVIKPKSYSDNFR